MDFYETLVSKLQLARRIRFADMFCAAPLVEYQYLKIITSCRFNI